MKQLFLSPRSSETAYQNFQSSLAQGRNISEVKYYLNENEIRAIGKRQTLFVWGAQPSLRSKWEKMSVGDYILFYERGFYVMAAEVLLIKYSVDLALKLWPKSADTGEPWSCLYFVDNLRQMRLPIEKFNDLANYKMPILRGFQKVTDPHLDRIVSSFGSLDKFIDSETIGLKNFQVGELNRIGKLAVEKVDSEDLEKVDSIFGDRDPDEVIAELSARNMDKLPEERTSQQKRILRDYCLVKAMKERRGNKCQVCGFTFITRSGRPYSEAAHIKPIFTRELGLDVADNILILCPNHHKMLDFGAMKVVDDLTIEIDGKEVKIKK